MVDRLLDAATWAPSAVNFQPWAFGIIRDRARLDRYAERARAIYLSDPPAGDLASMPGPLLATLRAFVSEPGYDMFHGAPALITIYATAAEGVTDCFLAAENLMLAACAMGLGTCPIGLALPLMNQDDMKLELGVPPNAIAALPIVVGRPAEEAPVPSRNPPAVLYRYS
jgi:nitroreductase